MHVLSSGIHPEMDLMQTVPTSWSYIFLVLLKSSVFCAKHSQSMTHAPKSCCFHVRAQLIFVEFWCSNQRMQGIKLLLACFSVKMELLNLLLFIYKLHVLIEKSSNLLHWEEHLVNKILSRCNESANKTTFSFCECAQWCGLVRKPLDSLPLVQKNRHSGTVAIFLIAKCT